MRAMTVRGGRLAIEDVAAPTPGVHQVLARVLACGVCGSDLHALQGARARPGALDGVVMGHEFVAEVVAAGPRAERWLPGTRVLCSPTMPDAALLAEMAEQRQQAEATTTAGGMAKGPLFATTNLFLTGRAPTIGYLPHIPGGFGELMVLPAPLLAAVPDATPTRLAALTEPCAVGLHAVRAAALRPGEPALVMGAGPIGLMTLLWLKAEGAGAVTVSDPAAPRRALAARLGADRVLDPTTEPPARSLTHDGGLPSLVFECVGAPGTLQQAIDTVAVGGRVVVVGVCGVPDQIRPNMAIGKHLSLHFVLAYTVGEISEALAAIASGRLNVAPLITREVTLDQLPAAFEELFSPSECKVLMVG